MRREQFEAIIADIERNLVLFAEGYTCNWITNAGRFSDYAWCYVDGSAGVIYLSQNDSPPVYIAIQDIVAIQVFS